VLAVRGEKNVGQTEMSISQYQLDQMLARMAHNKATRDCNGEPEPPPKPAQREDKLHDEILDFCREKGWLVIHSRMDMPSTVGVGTADFVILRDGGRTLLVEAKARNNKPTPAQLAWLAWAKRLGHPAFIVRSLQEFLEFVES
jgi:hypothetical protein